MARATEGQVSGNSTVSRIASRLDMGQLQRQSMPGGGSVLRGPLATRALKSVGARAMTVDRSIIVSEDFNPSNPEDAALYAHEAFHAQHGDGEGGGGGSNFRDAEEVAARAIERMTFHRMTGGYEGGNQPAAGPGAGHGWKGGEKSGGATGASTSSSASSTPESTHSKPDPVRGYWAMIDQGFSHADIVEDLARRVVGAMDDSHQSKLDRHGDKRGTIQ